MNWVENASWLGGADIPNQFNVVEGNIFDSNGTQGIQLASPNNIYRRNVFIGHGWDGIGVEGWGSPTTASAAPYAYGNRLYHNTFVANGATTGGPRPGGVFFTNWGITTVNLTNNHFKNNIFIRNDNSNNQFTIALSPSGTMAARYFNHEYPHRRKLFQRPAEAKHNELKRLADAYLLPDELPDRLLRQRLLDSEFRE